MEIRHMHGFLETIYSTLFRPAPLFRGLAMEAPLRGRTLIYGMIIVLLVSSLGSLVSPFTLDADALVFQMVFGALAGFGLWLFTGGLFSLVAYVFQGHARPQLLLTLTAYATLPWILLPIVVLFKGQLGGVGSVLMVAGCFALWVWSSLLFLAALKYTYHLTLDRVILVSGLPLMMGVIGFAWVCGFFANLVQFLSL